MMHDDPRPTTVDYFTPTPTRGSNRRKWVAIGAGVLAFLVVAFYLGLCISCFMTGEHRL